MAVVTAEEEGRAKGKSRRVETPAKRTIEDSVPRYERVSAKPRIPIPSITEPSRSAHDVGSGRVYVGLGQIGRPQAGPSIELGRFEGFLIKLPGLERLVIEAHLVARLDFHLFVAVQHHGLAVEHPHLVIVS